MKGTISDDIKEYRFSISIVKVQYLRFLEKEVRQKSLKNYSFLNN